MLATLFWMAVTGLVAADVTRGSGRLSGRIFLGLAAWWLWAGAAVMPALTGALLTVGILKALGARIEWRAFGLALVTTPDQRALPPGD